MQSETAPGVSGGYRGLATGRRAGVRACVRGVGCEVFAGARTHEHVHHRLPHEPAHKRARGEQDGSLRAVRMRFNLSDAAAAALAPSLRGGPCEQWSVC